MEYKLKEGIYHNQNTCCTEVFHRGKMIGFISNTFPQQARQQFWSDLINRQIRRNEDGN